MCAYDLSDAQLEKASLGVCTRDCVKEYKLVISIRTNRDSLHSSSHICGPCFLCSFIVFHYMSGGFTVTSFLCGVVSSLNRVVNCLKSKQR